MYSSFTEIVVGVLVVLILGGGLFIVMAHGILPGNLAKLEQLRSDVELVGDNLGEDVMGQVTEMNQALRAKQKYNSLWWADIFIPDAYDDLEVIKVR